MMVALPPLRTVIAQHGLDPVKGLGQHFLLDGNITAKIARHAGYLSGHTVFEIGPGPGGLTRALLGTPAERILAIERDHRCIAALQELAAAATGRLEIIEADATALNLPDLAGPPRAIVANLPYNVGTVLLLKWLSEADAYSAMTLMFQREVAERLAAQPGSKAYGRLSVIAQWRCAVSLCFHLPPRAFTPPPKVSSSVIRLEPRPLAADAAPFWAMEAVTAAAFGQRRKMLKTSLKVLGGAAELLDAAGIEPAARAEAVPVSGYERLPRHHAARAPPAAAP